MTDVRLLRARVKGLLKRPQPEQRTEAWYTQRQTKVTASECASCFSRSTRVCEPYVRTFGVPNFKYSDTEPLNPYETKEDYILKKCASFFGEHEFRDTVFTLWGKKYETVATRLYQMEYNTQVHEFGLINHSRYNWLAASPDGITPDGVMVEIKCPKARKIVEGVPPLYYWIQVQIQLEVCNLDACDFLECEIAEVTSEEAFRAFAAGPKQAKGILVAVDNGTDVPDYIYPPLDCVNDDQYIAWAQAIMNASPQSAAVYYTITKWNVLRIVRDPAWFNAVKHDIKAVHGIVQRMQQNKDDYLGYKESLFKIRNGAFLTKYEATTCLISDDDTDSETSTSKVLEETECLIASDDSDT